VRRTLSAGEKPLHWVGSSKRDFLEFPAAVKDDMGNALGIAQFGGTAPTTKPWKGLGPGVLEIVESRGQRLPSGLHRAVREGDLCLACLSEEVSFGYSDGSTGCRSRFRAVEDGREGSQGSIMARRNDREDAVTRGTNDVFADLGYPDATERQAKLRLAYALNQILDQRKLSQAEAAHVLGVTQPKVSALRHYKLTGFSVERLMNLLTALDQDVEIVIRRKPRSRRAARISVVAA
jgi:predicted XRE-type DNA-binding protein